MCDFISAIRFSRFPCVKHTFNKFLCISNVFIVTCGICRALGVPRNGPMSITSPASRRPDISASATGMWKTVVTNAPRRVVRGGANLLIVNVIVTVDFTALIRVMPLVCSGGNPRSNNIGTPLPTVRP